jgi:hypothetical protein
MPREIKLEYKQLKIYISAAKDIPDMDSILGERKKNMAKCTLDVDICELN